MSHNVDIIPSCQRVTCHHALQEDWKAVHNTADYITWVLLSDEEPYKMLSKKGSQVGHRPNQIEVEWETGSFPEWARPYGETWDEDESGVPKIESADRVWVLGKWIYGD